ncbi:MAG: hypothetical protein SGI97_07340 [candidate division Zixibacteria bacterium]|nr:hypothetical protein [candidate division Zixibacteria bacterium]
MNPFDCHILQPRAANILSRSHENKRVASTYLFQGREGSGQWPLAIWFSALINCQSPRKESLTNNQMALPCRECAHCKSIFSLSFPELSIVVPLSSFKNLDEQIELIGQALKQRRDEPYCIPVSPKTVNISIELAREVKRKLSMKAPVGITRVVIFDQMDKMLQLAADALLKLIEEPPPQTVIILTTAYPEALLPTIISRSQRIRLDRVSDTVITEYLKSRYSAFESRARLAARLSEGSPGRAVQLVQTGGDDEQSARATAFLLYKSLFAKKTQDSISLAVDLLQGATVADAEQILRLWQTFLRDSVCLAATGEDADLINIDIAAELNECSYPFNNAKVAARVTDLYKFMLADLKRNVHIQTAFVGLMLKARREIHSPAA